MNLPECVQLTTVLWGIRAGEGPYLHRTNFGSDGHFPNQHVSQRDPGKAQRTVVSCTLPESLVAHLLSRKNIPLGDSDRNGSNHEGD